VQSVCTAYGVEGEAGDQFERWHRSAPLVVNTGDPARCLLIHKFSEVDGTDEHIELATVTLPVTSPWYLAEPVQGNTILLPATSASALVHAVAQLT
jgi:hypothetical protein